MRSGAGWLVVITTAAAGVALAHAQPTGMSSTPSPSQNTPAPAQPRTSTDNTTANRAAAAANQAPPQLGAAGVALNGGTAPGAGIALDGGGPGAGVALDGGTGAGIALDGGLGGGIALQPQPRVAATQPVTAPQQAAQPGTTDTSTQTVRMVTPGGFVVPVPQQPAATQQQQGGGMPLPGGAVVVQGYGMSPAGVPILAPGSDGGADNSTLSGAGPTVSPGPAVGGGPEVGTGPEIGPDAGVGIGIR